MLKVILPTGRDGFIMIEPTAGSPAPPFSEWLGKFGEYKGKWWPEKEGHVFGEFDLPYLWRASTPTKDTA